MKRLYLGCTVARHKQLGIHAVINSRGGNQHLNDLSEEDIRLLRDARSIKDKIARRVRWYGPQSKFFRRWKNKKRIAHLIARYDD